MPELAQAALNVIAGEKAQDMSDLKVSRDLEPLKFAEFRIYYARLDYVIALALKIMSYYGTENYISIGQSVGGDISFLNGSKPPLWQQLSYYFIYFPPNPVAR